MPAKGWKKDDKDSNVDNLISNDGEGGDIAQYLFPRASLNRLAKQSLQSANEHPMLLAKDSQVVIQRGSLLFVNFIYHHAKQIVKENGRKVVNPDDILKALQLVGFSEFIPGLTDELDKFSKRKEFKKMQKLQQQQTEAFENREEGDEIAEDPRKKMKLTNLMNSPSPSTQDPSDVVNDEDDDENNKDASEDEDAAEEERLPRGSQLAMEQRELAGEEIQEND